MDIHAVINQRESRICVAQAVKLAVLTRLGTLEQTSFCEERFEGRTQVLCDRSIRQAKHGQVQLLLKHYIKRYVLDCVCA